jgi:hypothetical protein
MFTGGLIILAAMAGAPTVGSLHGVELGWEGCLQARSPLAAKAVPNPKNFQPVACPMKGVVPLRYDVAARVTRASRRLEIGDIVRRWPGAQLDAVRPGDVLTASVSEGAVRIDRRVTALQPALPGQGLFIRDDDGHVLTARYERSVQ